MKISLFYLTSLAAALPSASLGKRQVQELCDQYEYWSGNGYEVNNNLWGQDSGTGSQCTYIDGSSDSGLQWHTQWQWEGSPNEVKSYVNSGKMFDRGRTISSISSMQTSASWQYDTDVRANVAYDIFTAEDPNHETSGGDYEVMIWLARLGDVGPIGESTGMVTVDGKEWELFIGMNGDMKVFSFVAPSSVNDFSGDAKQFYNHLEAEQGFPVSSQNLIVFQFGTEAFTGGPATMTVSHFSAEI